MLRFLIVLLVVAFLPQGALASDDGIVRQLQTTTQCPTPYVWTQPSWWRKYLRLLKSRVLKKCEFLEGKVPADGTTCLASQEGNVCLFGEARCNNADEPETKCECTNGMWVCFSVCTQAICPVAMPSGWPNTCDPQVNVKSCNYGEHCCAGSCSSTAFCSCEAFQGQSSWLCANAAMEPCYEKSLEEAGCPCDRPIDGDSCKVDYACGEACCGQDAYTCTCNSGIYENCGKEGFIPLNRRDLSSFAIADPSITNLVASECVCTTP